MDFTQSMDNGYMIPTSVAVGSGEATDIRCVCDTVEDFKTFLSTTGMELRYEGLVTYEKVNKLLKVYKGNNVWQTVGEGGGNVDTSSFITLTQLSQQLSNYYTKAQADNKISEEIAKAQLGGNGEVDLSAYATNISVDAKIEDRLGDYKFRWVTRDEYDSLVLNGLVDEKTEYHITDEEDISVADLSLEGNKLKLIDEKGNTVGSEVALPVSGGGTFDTSTEFEELKTETKTIIGAINENTDRIVALNNKVHGLEQGGNLILRDVLENEIFEVEGMEITPPAIYGNIVTSINSLTLNEGTTATFTLRLDKAPTNDQIVNLSVNNAYCTLNKSNLIFTPSNYSSAQSIVVSGVHDSIGYTDKSSIITVSSANVANKSISVTVKNIDIKEDSPEDSTEPSVPVFGEQNNVSVVNIDGSDYFKVEDIALIKSLNGGTIFNPNTYKNEKYQLYGLNVSSFKNAIDINGDSLFKDNIKKSSATSLVSLLGDVSDGDIYAIVNGGILIRLPLDLQGFDTVENYLKHKYNDFYIKKLDTCQEKVIDASLIQSISVKLNNSDCQYAQFGYSDSPTSNIYSGINSLGFNVGSNANLSQSLFTPTCSMSTSILSIRFKPNTFEEFTLENVKKFLEENILKLWY